MLTASQHSPPLPPGDRPFAPLDQRIRERRRRSIRALQSTGFNLMLLVAFTGLGPLAEAVRFVGQYSTPLAFITLLGFFMLFAGGHAVGSRVVSTLARRAYHAALPLLLRGHTLSRMLDHDYVRGIEASAPTALPSPFSGQRGSVIEGLNISACYFPVIRARLQQRPVTRLAIDMAKTARFTDVPLLGCALLGLLLLLGQSTLLLFSGFRTGLNSADLLRPMLINISLLLLHGTFMVFFIWTTVQRHSVLIALCDLLLWDGEYTVLEQPALQKQLASAIFDEEPKE